ncbi:putative helicase mov-10-B-like isoform X2 [Aphelenchoides besseyi]|nr:putative helicase mov-10-B-like isoform X2 [Aphelenchoides besseyi]
MAEDPAEDDKKATRSTKVSDMVKQFSGWHLAANKNSANKVKCVVQRSSAEMVDLFADPIGIMRQQREKNLCHLSDVKENIKKVGAGQSKETFPSEYAFLLRLSSLDERTLRSYPVLWNLILSKPKTREQLVNKEVALISLNWAQELLDTRTPLIRNVSLIHKSTKDVTKVTDSLPKYMVYFTIPLPSKKDQDDQDEEERSKKSIEQVRRGTILQLISSGRKLPKVDFCSPKELSIPQLKVHYLNNKELVVKTKVSSLKDLLDSLNGIKQFNVYEVHTDFVPCAMLRSIQRIKKGLLDHILCPQPPAVKSLYTFDQSFNEIYPTIVEYAALNNRQARGLYSICTATHVNSPYLLHGPPGTGKTRVTAATVKCLLEMDPEFRILLTAPSNMACDMIAHKVMDSFGAVMNARNVLRLRSTGNDFHARDQRLDPIMKFDDEGEEFVIPVFSKLMTYRVIICTLGCSAHLVSCLPPGHFSHIFLDEAGQASESEIWIPLGGLANNNTSVVFCGDNRQLGPVITLDLTKNITDTFESPLVRYMNMNSYQTDSRIFCQLNRSYRCHQSILSIASEMFYSNDLRSGIVKRTEPFLQWKGLPNKDFPMMFVSVKGYEILDKKTKSYGNKAELGAVLDYLRRLLDDFPKIKPEDIGVISPYRYQTYLLTTALNNSNIRGKEKITVDSVERFQGSERKVIIISTTRTNQLGFVACDRRLNTSITRAMNLLIVIGDEYSLSRHESWKRFLDYCVENKAFVRWDWKKKTDSNALPSSSPRFAAPVKQSVHLKHNWHAKKIVYKNSIGTHKTPKLTKKLKHITQLPIDNYEDQESGETVYKEIKMSEAPQKTRLSGAQRRKIARANGEELMSIEQPQLTAIMQKSQIRREQAEARKAKTKSVEELIPGENVEVRPSAPSSRLSYLSGSTTPSTSGLNSSPSTPIEESLGVEQPQIKRVRRRATTGTQRKARFISNAGADDFDF